MVESRTLGSATIIGLLLTVVLSFLILKNVLSLQVIHRHFRNRSEVYLCFREGTLQMRRYLTSMEGLNQKIIEVHRLKILSIVTAPETTPSLQNLESAYQRIQEFKHFAFLKNLANLKHCSLSQRGTFVLNVPYRMTPRRPNGSAPRIKSTMHIRVFGARADARVGLRGDYELHDHHHRFKAREEE